MAHLLYLSGPITGCTYEGCTDWRDKVTKMLPPDIIAVSPMRKQPELKAAGVLTDSYEGKPFTSGKGIVCRDRFDVQRCDVMLVNVLGTTTISKGTLLEVGQGDMRRMPIILAIEKGNVHEHAMLYNMAGFVVDNLDEAVHIAISVLAFQ